jgi:hypothetical protein
MLNTLDQFLDRITALTTRAEDHLSSTMPTAIAELARIRAEQARIITAYQLFVHREVFEPLIRSGSATEIARAKELKTECIILSEEFRSFARCWAIDDVERDWCAYRTAALDLAKRIRQHAAKVRATAPAFLSGRHPSPSWRMAS